MEIVHILPSDSIGGVQSFVADLADYQTQQDDVYIVFEKYHGIDDRRFANFEVLSYREFFKRLLMAGFHNAVLHTHGHVLTKIGFLSLIFPPRKVVHTIHNMPQYESGRYRRLLHKFLFDTGRIKPVCISRKLLSETNALYKANYTNYVLNGVSLRRTNTVGSEKLKYRNRRFNLLFIGRLDSQKNLDLLLRSLNAFESDVQWHLHVVGRDYGVYERELFSSFVNSESLTYYGELNDVSDFLLRADLLVVPSLFEGLPILLLEAKHHKMPVLCTNVGGCPEVIGENDLRCEPDVLSMRGALSIAFENFKTHGRVQSESSIDISMRRCGEQYGVIYEQ